MKQYPYYNKSTLQVDFEEMLSHLSKKAKPGDIILLHGCCHNPTGADLSDSQWDRLAIFLNENELYPFIDLAYFGLGKGMKEDTYGLRKVTQICPEVLLAASCSKNFALYRDRTGFVAAICKDQEKTQMIKVLFGAIQRKLISMPPDHGAAIVNKIFTDHKLFDVWEMELNEMRNRIKNLRLKLSEAFNSQGASNIANAIINQNGMFSMLPLNAQQAESLRSNHAIYLMNSGRINIAGANTKNINRVAEAVLKVI
jgi:aspartate aminotransferase